MATKKEEMERLKRAQIEAQNAEIQNQIEEMKAEIAITKKMTADARAQAEKEKKMRQNILQKMQNTAGWRCPPCQIFEIMHPNCSSSRKITIQKNRKSVPSAPNGNNKKRGTTK